MNATQLAASVGLAVLTGLFSQAAEATNNTTSACGTNVPNCVILPPPPPPSCGGRPCGSPAPTPAPVNNTNTNNNNNNNTNNNSANAAAHAAAQAAASSSSHSNSSIHLANGAITGGTSTSSATIQTGAVQNHVAGGNSTIQTGAVQNTVAGGSVAAGAVQNHVAGSNATIQTGAVQNTNNVAGGSVATGAVQNTVTGGSVAEGAVQTTNNVSGGSVAAGAVQSTNTATNAGNTVNINNPAAKQATPIVAPNLVGGVSGCVVQNSWSAGFSAVGVGGLTVGKTSGGEMVKGCAEFMKEVTGGQQLLQSDNTALVVTGLGALGLLSHFDGALKDEARLNALDKWNRRSSVVTPPPAPAAGQPIVLVVPAPAPAPASSDATARSASLPAPEACFAKNQKGVVVKGEWVVHQVQGVPGGVRVCEPGRG